MKTMIQEKINLLINRIYRLKMSFLKNDFDNHQKVEKDFRIITEELKELSDVVENSKWDFATQKKYSAISTLLLVLPTIFLAVMVSVYFLPKKGKIINEVAIVETQKNPENKLEEGAQFIDTTAVQRKLIDSISKLQNLLREIKYQKLQNLYICKLPRTDTTFRAVKPNKIILFSNQSFDTIVAEVSQPKGIPIEKISILPENYRNHYAHGSKIPSSQFLLFNTAEIQKLGPITKIKFYSLKLRDKKLLKTVTFLNK